MCQARTSEGEIIKKITSIASDTLDIEAKRRLNPAAIEFVSSRSESEASSIGDQADTDHSDSEDTSSGAFEKNRQHKQAEKRQGMDQYHEDTEEQHRFHGYQNYGWESPQGVLPPAGASPPPGQAVAYTTVPPGMMPPPHYSANGHQYGPSHYPVYLYHHPEGIERSASPPAIYPAGGSPPLAPGFISVPLQHQHSGHMRGSSPIPGGSPPSSSSSRGVVYDKNFPPHSVGMHHPAGAPMPVHPNMASSPPGNNGNNHYHVYPAPHHVYAPHHQVSEEYPQHPQHHLAGAHPGSHHYHAQYDNGMMAELQPRMSAMSLSGSSPPEGSSPTRNNTRASARIARSHRAGGAYNPSDFEFKISPSTEDGTADADVKTTVMIRNIPNKYTQEIMLNLLEDAGLVGSFDFFYLPIDFRNRCGLGYAFLNFLGHNDAVKAYSHFHNRRWDEFNSKKVCEVTYARVQGRDNLVQHFKNAKFPSTDAEYCPLVYRHVQSDGADGDGESRVQAHMPLPIHEYLVSVEEEEVAARGTQEEKVQE